MSQARSTALDVAIAKAAERHQHAEKALANAQAKLRGAQSTYGTLEAYCGEYAGRMRQVTTATRDALTNHRRFLDKLGLALDQQKQGVEQAGAALSHQQDAWFTSMRKLKAMELLRDRRTAAAQASLKRVEQKQSDEFAARSARRGQTRNPRFA